MSRRNAKEQLLTGTPSASERSGRQSVQEALVRHLRRYWVEHTKLLATFGSPEPL